MNLKRWNFVQHPSKPPLSLLDVNYWKSSLDKILKVGAELEFNLPDAQGLCKGENIGCGCVHLLTEDCWQHCLNTPYCKENAKHDRCMNKTDTCDPEDCVKCDFYKFDCLELVCSHFVSACHTCREFVVDCNECKYKYNPHKDPKNIRQQFKHQFTPNNCYGIINKSGVHSVKQDGSLLGDRGAEVITIGRRVNYWEFYNMFKNIIDTATHHGAYVNERCSIHMHVLASYYDKTVEANNGNMKNNAIPTYISELEKPLPEIVVLNLHQLIRKYQNALTWMGMALNDPNHMTRWEKFRVSVLDISPLMKNMKTVKDEVFHRSEGRKYGFVNYQFLKFDKNSDDLWSFHIEFRHMDGILSPSTLAAFACLWHAMVIKAVEISRYGILEMESSEWMDKARSMKESIMNNIGDWGAERFSDTTNIHKYEEDFREEAIDLIQQVKHILIQKGPSYDILENIAKEPIAYRLCRGEEWSAIEEQLKVQEPEVEENEFTKFIDELVDLRGVSGTESFNVWLNKVATILKQENIVDKPLEDVRTDVECYVNDKQDIGEFLWSESLGTIVAI